MRAVLVLIAAALLWLVPMQTASAPQPIQGQGSSPYCLFAVAGYLAGVDMWELETAYHRQNLPTLGLTPTNTHIFTLLQESYDVTLKGAKHKDWPAAKAAVQAGTPVGASGQGHAVVLLTWNDQGTILYLDSLRPGVVLSMNEKQFRAWSDGWYWWRR